VLVGTAMAYMFRAAQAVLQRDGVEIFPRAVARHPGD
jgi:hypothetical protein